ncbi:MAG: hypothetical protein AAF541_13855 [Pseudomonadota bacterium]
MSDQDKQKPSDEWITDLYREAREEPGAALDAAILKTAADESARPGGSGKKSEASTDKSAGTGRGWLSGRVSALATAAVLVVSAGIYFQVDEAQVMPSESEVAFESLDTAAKQMRAGDAVRQVKSKPGQAPAEVDPSPTPSGLASLNAAPQSVPPAGQNTADNPGELEEIVVAASLQTDSEPSKYASRASATLSRQAVSEEPAVDSRDSNSVWQASELLAPQLYFLYPGIDERGHDVLLDHYVQDGVRRIHAYSQDRSSVYAEVVLYPEPIDVDALHKQQKLFIETEDPRKQDGQVSKLIATFVQDRKANQASIRFREGDVAYERRMYFLNTELNGEQVGLRIVIDPRSQANHEIVEFLEFN